MSKYQRWAGIAAIAMLSGCGGHPNGSTGHEAKQVDRVARSVAETLEQESSLAELVSKSGCTTGVRALAARVARESPVERGDLYRVLGSRGAVDRLPEAAAFHVEQATRAVALASMACVSRDSAWLELGLKSWRSAAKWIDTAGGSDQDPVVRRLELGIRPMLQGRIDEANRLRILLSRASAVTDPRAAAWIETLASRQRLACDVGMDRGRLKVVRDMALRISRDHRRMARDVRHAMLRASLEPADSPQLEDVLPLAQAQVAQLEDLARSAAGSELDAAYVEAEIRMMSRALEAIDDSILPAVQAPEVIEAFVGARDKLKEDLVMARAVARLIERNVQSPRKTARK